MAVARRGRHNDITHRLFRELTRARVGNTRVVGGAVTEVGEGMVKVRISDDLEPVWARYDGLTAVGAPVTVTLGTDGRPIASSMGRIRPDHETEGTGPTGERIIGQQVQIDHNTQRIDAAHDRLDGMDAAIETASRMLVTSEALPPEDPDHAVGTIWQQTTYDLDTDETIVIGRWVLTDDGWVSLADSAGVIHAETVAAALGVFIDAMMENLTVVGAANISEAAIGELTVRVAEIIEVLAEQVVVGRDARFWSGGLVFYAPPAAGQDPEDWENRTPLVAVTPTGDTSIAVAQDGAVTAGMTPEGHVWGRQGNFDAVNVGGESLLGLIRAMPRGRVGHARVLTNIWLVSAPIEVFAARAQLWHDRAYDVLYQVGISRSAGVVRVQTWLRWDGGEVMIGQSDQGHNGDYTSTVSFNGSEFAFPDGAHVDVVTKMFTPDGTGTVWGLTSYPAGGVAVRVHDVGPAVEIHEVESGGPPAPPVTTHVTQVTSGHGWGIRPDGSNAIDPRLTVGGYHLYGSDMAEEIVFPVDFSALDGSTVLHCKVTFTLTQSGGSGTAYAMYAGTGPTSGRVNVYNDTAYTGGATSVWLPQGVLQDLKGKSAIVFAPFYPGSGLSYGYLAPTVSLELHYEK